VRIGFLFNHDAAHQVAHSVGIMTAYAKANPGDQVLALVSPALHDTVRKLAGDAPVSWVDFRAGPIARRVAVFFDRIAPFSRKAALANNLASIAGLDALMSTERTCLWAKRKLGEQAPKFIYGPHGAGDRNVAYHPDLAQFDLLLVPGQDWVAAARNAGVVHAGNTVETIGYPKFDVLADVPTPPRFFNNDNPVFVYNPHFDPHLSSWYDFGPSLIDWFAAHAEFNLIVAPHVMLFRKRFHWSLEYRTGRFRPDVPASAQAPNILVDVDSPRLFDMSYMRGSDAYIGDASSQIYEFMSKPRAAFIIDPHGEPLRHKQAGPVAKSLGELVAILPDYRAIAAQFGAAQRCLFTETFDPSPVPAGQRGADAIAKFMAARAC
jgi:hypothetical protein